MLWPPPLKLARGTAKNPEVPEWLKEEYFSAIQDLAKLGATEILRAKDPESVRAILSILALAKGARSHARFLPEYSEETICAAKRPSNAMLQASSIRSSRQHGLLVRMATAASSIRCGSITRA